MDRRSFLGRTLEASLLAGASQFAGGLGRLFAWPSLPYDLVAVRGGEPDAMFDSAMDAVGGMQAFVKRGDKVVVKPNIGWDVAPERGGNTNPRLVRRIIEHCFRAGAREVYVFDHSCDDWRSTYRNSGIERAAKDGGATVVPGNSERYYHRVSVTGGKALREAMVHELILETNVFINVPILKDHGSSKITAGMKNLMGIVWDRGYWHRNDLHECIGEFAGYRKPDLTVVDAYYVMKQNGPRGISTNDVVTMKAQLVSTDIVAVDTAAAKLYGISPEDVRYLRVAVERGIGRGDLENLNIKRIIV
jgi:uncharacterized protein (DUF362 family)